MEEKQDTQEKKIVRFKILVSVYGEPLIYKRYAHDEDEAKKILNDQLAETYGKENIEIKVVEKDKTKKAKEQ